MSVGIEAKKVAGEILSAALQAKVINPGGSDQDRAKAIAEAFKTIALAVANPGGGSNSVD